MGEATLMAATLAVEDLYPVFEQFQDKTGIVVTEKARCQIVELINCVQVDPSEKWPDSEVPEEYFQQWETVLPRMLERVVEDHRLERKLTMIDVVSWTGHNLDDFCSKWLDLRPFPKPDNDGPVMWKEDR